MPLSAAAAVLGRKDVVIGVLGATAALSGLVLVFLGVLVSTYQTLLGRAMEKTLERFRRAAFVALALFFLELAALAVVAAYATVWVLLR